MTLRRIARLPEPTGRGADFLNAYSYDGPLFHPNSVWNTPIPASAQVDANSANMMRTTIDGDGQGRTLGYAMSTHTNFHVSETSGGFSSRVWYADAETAAVVVKDRYGYTVTAGTPHPNSPIRIPSVATPASGSDGHMVVWDLVNHYVYEFWNALDNGDGTWSMGQNAKWLDYGNGYQPYTPHTLKPAARAFGGALMGGQIRYWELRRRRHPHALEYSYPWSANHNYAQGLGRGRHHRKYRLLHGRRPRHGHPVRGHGRPDPARGAHPPQGVGGRGRARGRARPIRPRPPRSVAACNGTARTPGRSGRAARRSTPKT
jgi:hypothetical protein